MAEKARLAEAQGRSVLDSITVKTCAVCDASQDLQKCGRCWKVVYCSVAHQRQDWSRHRRICGKALT